MTLSVQTIPSAPFDDQKPGTSGLRKKTRHFQQAHYLENFVEAVFRTLEAEQPLAGARLVIGGDGRYYNTDAIQIIVRMALARNVGELLIGQYGFLSTPAASCVIRKYQARGGFVLSASHNPGGPDEDFGIKFNAANGGPAPESLTEAIYAHTLKIDQYRIAEAIPLSLEEPGVHQIGMTRIEVIDPVADYAALMREQFDFPAIQSLLAGEFRFCFDAMHAITGIYARRILEGELGAPEGSVINGIPLPDFGGGHPDPNLTHAHDLVAAMQSEDGPDFGAASDGDGDRNMILGRHTYVTPSDSVAIIAANADCIPALRSGLIGVARSMPTSAALDTVAKALGIACYETPTGWKFFGNLLDAGRIRLCGEESFGTGSDHVREKDGLWAVLCWLNILAVRKQSVLAIQEAHWQRFGRHYYTRHDYEGLSIEQGAAVFSHLRAQLADVPVLEGLPPLTECDEFSYTDPVDGSISSAQGLRFNFADGSRIVYRLSGTGTVGATLRIYIEKPETRPDQLAADTQALLASYIRASVVLANLPGLAGRDQPSVIT